MNIVLIGTGNVAQALGKALARAGHRITQVYSRKAGKARKTARPFSARHTSSLKAVDMQADIVIIAVADKAVEPVLRGLSPGKAVVVHTSGSIPLAVFGKPFKRYGVVYPVQTISREFRGAFADIPLCIEGGDPGAHRHLLRLAKSISRRVYTLHSGQRAQLHLAAVFANNFTNHLIAIATAILERQHLPPALLQPLLAETFAKLQRHRADAVQTGPARRGETKIIRQHLAMLKRDPAWRKIYALMSRDIMKLA